jgi:shikimate dehydrogenase
MRRFGLIGYPLGHSFSKRYFTTKFASEKITDCSYENYPLQSLDGFYDLLHTVPDLEGLNVTIPYKSEIIRFLDNIDPEALEIGAVNVLKIRRIKDRIEISGFNSDVTGIRDSIVPYLSEINQVMVLGTGGSSKAVSYVLEKEGLIVSRVSRTRRTDILNYNDVSVELLEKTQLIINTTPLGMFPDTESRPDINYDLLGRKHILFDLVYNPELTSFLKMGQERGCRIISGIKMLHSQAERAWEIWNSGQF